MKDVVGVLRLVSNPDRGTVETINEAREFLNKLWWVKYCEYMEAQQ